MNVSEILIGSLSADPVVREKATSTLEQAASQNYPMYLEVLLNELGNDAADAWVRSAAGLAIKNTLYAKDPERRQQQAQRWISLDAAQKDAIRKKIVGFLGSTEGRVGTVAAQIVQCIAYVELPRGEWTDLMNILLQNLVDKSSSVLLRKATLEAIGFICEESNSDILVSQSNAILSGVLSGLQMESEILQLAAANSLCNSLKFVQEAFLDNTKRDYIMSTVCSVACSSTDKVVVIILECVIKIMQLYYDHMEPYMEPGLFPMTMRFLASPHEDVVLQAIEFWSTTCEIEYQLLVGENDGFDGFFFAKKSLPFVVPVMLKLLIKKEDEEEEDEDEWNVSMAASTCLSLWADCTQEAILLDGKVVEFIRSNIRNSDWRSREAAVMALACILTGPPPTSLIPVISEFIPIAKQLVFDPSDSVKDTAAWTLGRCCDVLLSVFSNEEILGVADVFVKGLELNPRAACHCAWGLSNIASHFTHPEEGDLDDNVHAESNALTNRFEVIVSALFVAMNRPDSSQNNLKAVAYESMIVQIAGCGTASLPIVEQVLISVLDQLTLHCEKNIQLKPDEELSADITETQAHLCSLLQAIIPKIGPHIKPHANRIMTIILSLLSCRSVKMTYIFEDIFLATGTLIIVLGEEFIYYMPSFFPFLLAAIQNYSEVQLCTITIALVGDLCRALHRQITPFSETIIETLFSLLRVPAIDSSLYPCIVTCFGDLALAMEADFEKNFSSTMNLLAEVSQRANSSGATSFESQSTNIHKDWAEHSNQLRISVLEALTCLIQGLKSGGKATAFSPHVPSILEMIHGIQADQITTVETTKAAIALLGDIADSLGSAVQPTYNAHEWILPYIRKYKTDKRYSSGLRKIANWAYTVVSVLYPKLE